MCIVERLLAPAVADLDRHALPAGVLKAYHPPGFLDRLIQ